MIIRPYTYQDKPELVALLQLNIPKYFAPSEAADYEEYLEQHAEHYFVLEVDGTLLGAGGFNLIENGEARISWDFIHPDHQGKGYGKQLTLFRINEIRKHPDVETIVVRTSQLVYPFYQKIGFELEKIEKDFWAEGFDLYQLRNNNPGISLIC